MFDKKNSLKNLFRGWRYFYVAEIYANKPGSASEDTFKEWSIRDSMLKNSRMVTHRI